MSRQKLVLEKFFKVFRESLNNNTEYRDKINKEAIFYFTEDLNELRNQVALVGSKTEAKFNTKYSSALEQLAKTSLSDLTFKQIQTTLKKKFLNEFNTLQELGIEVGHVKGNLTEASKAKALENIFEKKMSLRASNIEEVSDIDLQNISKTIAIIGAYQDALESLDKISTRKALISFLKRSTSFNSKAKTGGSLLTLEDIKDVLKKGLGDKSGAGWATGLGVEIFRDSILTLKPDTVIDMSRKISVTDKKVAVSFEVKALNQFKGTISNGIKTALLSNLDTLLAGGTLPKYFDDALTKSITQTLTKQEFLELFPNVTASKDIVTALEDSVVETLRTGKTTPYSSSKILPKTKLDIKNIKISLKGIKLPPVKIKQKPLRDKQGQFISPISIRNLLNSSLAQQIQKNMGKGSARNVLNYRTGRFANSAKVTDVNARDGAITAFYSYMKNPYSTFAPGGRQANPLSRDPNKLIQLSIRQLAAGIMATRLKVVPV
jgi:hypothetical protein